MANKNYKGNKNYNKNYNKNSQNKTHENNSQNPTSETFSYNNESAWSNYYFGFNIFDLYSEEDLVNLVKDPMGNNKILRELSRLLYGTNGTFSNTVDYMRAMPMLASVIVAKGNKAKKNKNKELMRATLKTIQDKQITRDALWNAMIDGVAFYYFETKKMPKVFGKFITDFDVNCISEINEVGMNASVISLPTDYTEIVGIKNNSYVLAFNLDYFNLAQGESAERRIKKFPKEIRDAYASRKSGNAVNNGNWVVLDNTKTMVLKIRSSRSEKYGRPLVLAAIKDILYQDYFTSTKRNVLNEMNNKIIYQTFPEGKEKGMSALTKNQQQAQHDVVKGAILNKNTKGGTSFVSVASGTKLNSLDVANTDIFDEKNESNLNDNIALDLGIAGSLLNGSSSGSYSSQENNLELLTAEIFDWIEQFSSELNKCISHNIIGDKRNSVEFVYLPITHVNKKNMIANMKDLYLQGCGSIQAWIASTSFDPEAYFALLDDEIENGVYEKYKPHATSFTMSGDDNGAGRPQTDNPADKTVASRNVNGNANPSPSDK